MDKNKFKQRMKDVPASLLLFQAISLIIDLLTKRIVFSFRSIYEALLKRLAIFIIAYLIIALFWYLFGLTEKKK